MSLKKAKPAAQKSIEADEEARGLNELKALWKETLVFSPDRAVALARGRF